MNVENGGGRSRFAKSYSILNYLPFGHLALTLHKQLRDSHGHIGFAISCHKREISCKKGASLISVSRFGINTNYETRVACKSEKKMGINTRSELHHAQLHCAAAQIHGCSH
jgi:hypothetical protein